MTTLEFMARPAAERELINEVNRLRELVTMLQGWLDDRNKTCETLRNARDSYARQLGLANSWDVAESVREKYDPREELEEVEA